MKNITYSLVLLSIFSHSGGDILPVEAYVDNFEEKDVTVEIPAVKIKKVIKKKVLKEIPIAPKKPMKGYIGLSIASLNFDSTINGNVLENGHPLALIGKIGYDFMDNLGIEARAGVGVKTDTIGTATDKLKSLYAVYLKPNVTVFEKVNVFGLLGYGTVNETVNGISNNSSGASYGAGLSYKMSENLNIGIDAVRYATKNSQNSDAYAFGFEYKF